MGTRSRIDPPLIPYCLSWGYRNRVKHNWVSVDKCPEKEGRGEGRCNSHRTLPHRSVWGEGRERGGGDRGREDWRGYCDITHHCDVDRVLLPDPGNWLVC